MRGVKPRMAVLDGLSWPVALSPLGSGSERFSCRA
jgi:hypothetical protein